MVSAVPKLVSIKATGLNVKVAPSDAEEDASEDEASTTLPAQDSAGLPRTPSAGEEEFSVSDAGFPPVMVWVTTQEGHLICLWILVHHDGFLFTLINCHVTFGVYQRLSLLFLVRCDSPSDPDSSGHSGCGC